MEYSTNVTNRADVTPTTDTQPERQTPTAKPPLISVIVPAHNQASLVTHTLERVLNQPYRNLEILVVNNGSTDDTARALQPYHDRIRYFYQENEGLQGQGRAINLGIQAARGEYIHTLAAGDLVTEVYYTRVMQAFQAQPHIGAVATDAYRLREDAAPREIIKVGHFRNQQEFLLEGLDHNPIIASTMIVKGFCYEAVGLHRPQWETLSDYDLWLRIGAQFEIAYLSAPLVQCRTPENDAVRHTAKMWNLERQVVREFRRQTAVETFFPELRRQPDLERYAQAHERIGRIFAAKGWHDEAAEEFSNAASYQTSVTKTPSAIRHPPSAVEPVSSSQPRQPLRILVVIHDFLPHNFAGAEVHTYHQAKALQAAGHEVVILHPSHDNTQPEGALSESHYEDLKIYTIGAQPKQWVSTFRNDVVNQAFATFLQHHSFDVIHFQHLMFLGGALMETAKKQGIPTVLTLHDAWFLCQEVHMMQNRTAACTGPETVDKCVQCFIQTRLGPPEQLTAEDKAGIYQLTAYRKEYLRPLLAHPDVISAPSRYMQQMFTQYGVAGERITLLPYGIPLQKSAVPSQPRDRSVLRFVFLGNIAPIKGVHTLVRAFKQVRHRAQLHIYGKVSDSAYANQIFEEIKGSDAVIYQGAYRPEALYKILADTDCLVLASLNDNSPLVIREAFQAGVPVIASTTGGIPELVQDGVNGLLFRTQDIDDLKEKLEQVCANPSLLDTLRAGIPPTRTIEVEVQELQAIYQRIIESRTVARPTESAERAGTVSVQPIHTAPPNADETTRGIQPSAQPGVSPTPVRMAPAARPQVPDKICIALYSMDPLEYACPIIRLISPLTATPIADQFRLNSQVTITGNQSNSQVLLKMENLEAADVIVFQRNAVCLEGGKRLVDRVRQMGKPLVYETDDNLIDLPVDHPQKAFYDTHRERTIHVATAADIVTVSTPRLREFFLKYNPNVAVLPNAIDLDLWSEPPTPRRNGHITMVYAGTLTHDRDLETIAPALKHILQKYQGRVVMRFWGYVPPSMRYVAGVESIGQLDNNYRNFARNFRRETFDIGLAPLADTPFNLCKSHIKYLEYAACRIPGVYSHLEPYTASVREGMTGLFAGSDLDEWVAALERLIQDESLRRALGENAYWDVVSQHSVSVRCEDWARLYTSLSRQESPRTAAPAATATAPAVAPIMPAVVANTSVHSVKKASVIIPVFNQAVYTQKCLEALFANTQYANYEVLVVDNGSTDETPQVLAPYKLKIRLIRNETNQGFAKACNQGARAARGEYLVFLNNDTLPQASWLDALIASAEQEPQAAVIGAKLLYPNNTIQHAGVIFSASAHLPYHIYRSFERAHPAVNRIREFPAVTGACMLVKRGVFFEAGLFDESYVNCYEDVDLCMKVREMGYKVLYNPLSEVYHYESVTEGRRDRSHLDHSAAVLHRKWDQKMPADETRYYTEDGLTIEYLDANNLKISPLSEAEQRIHRARALKSQGQFQEALRTLESLTDEKHHAEICTLMGDCLAHMDQADQAAAQYREAIRLNPQSGRAHIGLGVLAVGRGQFEEAKAAFDSALAMNPQNDNALCGLGIALWSQGRPEPALEKFRQALDVNPENMTALSNLQACAYEQKAFDVAEEYFRHYLAACPGDLTVRFGLAGIYTLMGDIQQAQQALYQILKLDPTHKDAATLLQRLDTATTAAVS